MYFSSHTEMRKLDKTETLVTIGDMTYVREVTKTDFYNCMRLYVQSDSVFAHFLSMIELVSLLLRWPKWLTFHFHTTSQLRIPNSQFRIPYSEFRNS